MRRAAALPGLPQVACFDTAFHRTLAPAAATYALPRAWNERFELRRYGFHGLNVAWCHEQAQRILGAERSRRLVVCHLGSGCSVSAVLDGRSVDTTMGFTPLDGVPMATRSGSLDPGLLLHLLDRGIGRDELARRAQPPLRAARAQRASRGCARSNLLQATATSARSSLRRVRARRQRGRGDDDGAVRARRARLHVPAPGRAPSLLRAHGLLAARPARRRARRVRNGARGAIAHAGAPSRRSSSPAGEEIVIARETAALLARRDTGAGAVQLLARSPRLSGFARRSSKQLVVRPGDQLRGAVTGLELGEAAADRARIGRRSQLGADRSEALARLEQCHVRHHAEKLVAAETDDQVVGAQLRSDVRHDAGEQLIAGAVALAVVAGLQPDDVGVCDDEPPAIAPAAVELVVEVDKAGGARARSGQRVALGDRQLARE